VGSLRRQRHIPEFHQPQGKKEKSLLRLMIGSALERRGEVQLLRHGLSYSAGQLHSIRSPAALFSEVSILFVQSLRSPPYISMKTLDSIHYYLPNGIEK
jgi:hypothetical protein